MMAVSSITEGVAQMSMEDTYDDTMENRGNSFSSGACESVCGFLVGPAIANPLFGLIEQRIARQEGSLKFFTALVYTFSKDGNTADDKMAMLFLHTEHSFLASLKGESGFFQCHGFSKMVTQVADKNGATTNLVKNYLFIDCFIPNNYDERSKAFTTLREYGLEGNGIGELKATEIFYKVTKIVKRMHELNMTHGDLKLGNIILNRETQEIFLSNIGFGRYLRQENELQKDKKGTPAYAAPEMINCRSHLGKPRDMWALGVSLYILLFGNFPFYHHDLKELGKLICSGKYSIEKNVFVTPKTLAIIHSLLNIDPTKRPTAADILAAMQFQNKVKVD